MDRRQFLQYLAAYSATTATSQLGLGLANAAANPSHDLPLFICINANGGWDASLFCDPKSGPDFPLNNFKSSDYIKCGNLTIGPGSPAATQFFQQYYQRILVINGINAETVDHNIGNQLSTSGNASPQFACFDAIAAATFGPTLGLSFVSGGGYDETAHEISKTLASTSLFSAMSSMSGTNRTFNASEQDLVAAAVAARLKRQQAAANLAIRQQDMLLLQQARSGFAAFPNVLKTVIDLQTNVPLIAAVKGDSGTRLDQTNSMIVSAQLALAGYVNNATISANIGYGNFDMHSNFSQEYVEIDNLFIGLDYLLRAAAHLGIADKLLVMVGSDFTRTPYNIGSTTDPGKGHWNNTASVLMFGAHVPGNTVIGQSTNDASFKGLPIDPKTLQPAATGVLMTRAHVHNELRRVAGLIGTPLDKKYPLTLNDGPLQFLV